MRTINNSEKEMKNEITKTKYFYSEINCQFEKAINEWVDEYGALIINIVPLQNGGLLVLYKK